MVQKALGYEPKGEREREVNTEISQVTKINLLVVALCVGPLVGAHRKPLLKNHFHEIYLTAALL